MGLTCVQVRGGVHMNGQITEKANPEGSKLCPGPRKGPHELPHKKQAFLLMITHDGPDVTLPYTFWRTPFPYFGLVHRVHIGNKNWYIIKNIIKNVTSGPSQCLSWNTKLEIRIWQSENFPPITKLTMIRQHVRKTIHTIALWIDYLVRPTYHNSPFSIY